MTGIAYAANTLDVELVTLTPKYSSDQVTHGFWLLRLLEGLKKQKKVKYYQKKYQLLQAIYHNLLLKLGEDLDDLLDRIKALLEKRYRASSAATLFVYT